eukprot:COSAG01_NODE_47728_length_387_cov_1.843750_1_plen_83_part_10
MSIVVPKGNYNLSDIEIQIAKELLKTHDGTEETIWGRLDTAAKGFMVPPDNNTPVRGPWTTAGTCCRSSGRALPIIPSSAAAP